MLGAHYDSVAAGPGANDNASGVAVMLEAARVLAEEDLPFDLRVVAFGAEEIGLVGSAYYVDQLATAENDAVIAMINMDMVGVGDQLVIGGADSLVELVRASALAMGLEPGPLPERYNRSSDHASFSAAGIPAVFIHWMDDPDYHTAADVAENVDPLLLSATGRIALRTVDRLAAD